MPATDNQRLLDAIILLAEEIGRAAPECSSQAMQIVELARGLSFEPDRATIQDVIDAEMADDGLSDAHEKATASAVAKALKTE